MPSLYEKLVEVLQEKPLSLAEIRRQLKQRWGHTPTLPTLLRALTNDRFRRLTGDQYALAELVEEQPPLSPVEEGILSLINLPNLEGQPFVVVDVETTGINPQEDRVFQVAGVLFVDGFPERAFSRYLSPAPKVVSEQLRRKLGIATKDDA